MSNYLAAHSYTEGKFSLNVHPYIAVPDNLFDSPALQYGGDFEVAFDRAGSHNHRIGLLQLIFPQTAVFPHTRVREWNVDKRAPSGEAMTLEQALYGTDGVRIGSHSASFNGQPMRDLGTGRCSLIDTPREFNNRFSAAASSRGVFQGKTQVQFANYVVELNGRHGGLFDQGVTWSYEVQQATSLTEFTMAVTAPEPCRLSQSDLHRAAMERFLQLGAGDIKKWIVA